MFYVDETLVGECSCEAKLSISRIDHGSKIGGQKKRRFACMKRIFFVKWRPGSARLGSARLGSSRAGSARLGSARPGPAWDRPGKCPHFWLDFLFIFRAGLIGRSPIYWANRVTLVRLGPVPQASCLVTFADPGPVPRPGTTGLNSRCQIVAKKALNKNRAKK